MELQASYAQFRSAGIELVVITYDSEEDQAKFIRKHNIQFPLLSDIDMQSVTALGILNENYKPGDMAYGIPHPGFYVLNRQAGIVAKSFLERYQQRLSASAIFRIANTAI